MDSQKPDRNRTTFSHSLCWYCCKLGRPVPWFQSGPWSKQRLYAFFDYTQMNPGRDFKSRRQRWRIILGTFLLFYFRIWKHCGTGRYKTWEGQHSNPIAPVQRPQFDLPLLAEDWLSKLRSYVRVRETIERPSNSTDRPSSFLRIHGAPYARPIVPSWLSERDCVTPWCFSRKEPCCVVRLRANDHAVPRILPRFQLRIAICCCLLRFKRDNHCRSHRERSIALRFLHSFLSADVIFMRVHDSVRRENSNEINYRKNTTVQWK